MPINVRGISAHVSHSLAYITQVHLIYTSSPVLARSTPNGSQVLRFPSEGTIGLRVSPFP